MTNKINLKQGIKKYYPLGFLFLIIFGFILIQEAKAKGISVGTASDNIGIGTDNPGTTYRLNVNGNSNITGTLNVTGGITGSSLGATLLGASNVSAGAFGSNSGGGNYSFPGTLSASGKLYLDAAEGLGVFGIRGRNANEQIEMYNSVSIGSPNGWTVFPQAPNFGLSVYGGANFATNQGVVGIGTTAPVARLQITGTTQIESPTLGSANGGSLFVTNADPLYGLLVGVGPSGNSWLQAQRVSGATAYNLNLQPSGGNVGIGGSASPQAKLQIAGNFSNVGTGVQDGNDRPGLSVTGYYPQIVLMAGGQSNTNHGSTISLGSFDSGTSGAFKSWTLGTPGINATWMDIGYGTNTNPHLNGISGYGTTVMRLQSNGNVGIGTSGPQVRLDVQGGGNSYGANIYGMWTPDGNSLIRNWALNDGTNNYGSAGQGTYTAISDAPMGSKTMRYSGPTNWRNQQWIPVDITKTYKVSLWGRTISGTPNNYISLTQANADLAQPVNGGWGNPYWGRVNEAFPTTWTYYSMTIGPSGSGANYAWSSDTKYVQLGALMIYTGSGVCEITGYKMEEVPSTIANGTTALGNLTVTGTISGAMSGTLNAANLSAGTFGSNTGGGNYTFPGAILLPAPTGDPSPVITSRVVPAGQGAGGEKTELILFHSNDGYNGAGPDQITLRAPALSFQTYTDPAITSIADNGGFNERLYIQPGGNVGVGTNNPLTKLHVSGTLTVDPGNTSGYTEGIRIAAASNGYSIVNFGADPASASGSQGNQWWIGKDGRDNGLNIWGNSPGDVLHILSNGNVGIGTTGPGYKLDVAGDIRSRGNIYTNANYGYGLIGTYTSDRYQGVFSMGDAYKLPADGSSPGNLYGLAWSHPNAGGVASNLNTHGLLVMENGTFLAAISGSIRSRDDMRSPIFYDNNDTSFYVDPNSTSRLNNLTVTGSITGNISNADTVDGVHASSFFQYEGFNLDANWMGRNRSGFTYSVGAPWTGPVVRFDSANYDLELNGTYSGGTGLSYRIKNGDNNSWNSWYRIYSDAYRPYADVAENVVTPTSGYKHLGAWAVGRTDTGAILVNTAYRADYAGSADSAGNADTVDGQHFAWSNRSNGPTYVWAADSNGDSYLAYRPALSVAAAAAADKLNGVGNTPNASYPGQGLKTFYNWGGSNCSGRGPTDECYANGISIGSAPGDQNYGFQLVQNMWDDNLYFRRYNAGWQTWYSVVYKDSANNSTIGGTMTSAGFIYNSDVKLKKNIATIESPLTKILQLRGVTFNWKKDNTPGVGLIAQEVEQVFPELVSESGGIKSVQYGNLVAPLIEAVKEQQTEIQNQQNQINEMKAQIKMLQAKN